MNENRVEYMIRLKAAGYEPQQFKKPIFYFDPRFEEQIVQDILWIYRNKYDQDFAMNAIDFEPTAIEIELDSNDQIYYLRNTVIWNLLTNNPIESLVDMED